MNIMSLQVTCMVSRVAVLSKHSNGNQGWRWTTHNVCWQARASLVDIQNYDREIKLMVLFALAFTTLFIIMFSFEFI